MLLARGWHHHGGVREHEPRVHLMEPGTDMRDASANARAAGMSPLRLRVGVFLILLWIVPFWALAPYIADSLSGLSNPPSVAAVTTTIFVVQTIIGLLGSWVAGTQAKSIIMGPRRGMPSGPSDRYSSTGLPEVRATSAMIRMKGDHHPRTPSCFTVAARLQYPNAIQLRAWKKPPASDPPARRPCVLPLLKSHGCCSLW